MRQSNDWVKFTFIVLAFLEAFILGLLPVWIKAFKQSPRLLSTANSFAGGVFLAIALLHIMPEQVRIYAQISDFPLPFMLLVAGYTIILIIDKIVLDPAQVFPSETVSKAQASPGLAKARSALEESAYYARYSDGAEDLEMQKMNYQKELALSLDSKLKKSEVLAAHLSISHDSRCQDCEFNTVDLSFSEWKPVAVEYTSDNMQSLIDDQEDTDIFKNKSRLASSDETKRASSMTPFVILIGLGVHSIFEGLSLGLSSQTSSSLIFAVAIILHKGAAALSLGVSMAKTFPGREAFVTKMMLLFALFTPLGVFLGWLLEGSHAMTELVFSCLAAGSFLYIACSEVIIEEFSVGTMKGLKLCCYFLGIALIASLLLFE